MDGFLVSIGIALAGYFIGDGLKNFKNPNAKEAFDLGNEPELIRDSNVHHYLGISKEDAKVLVQEFPDIPHITLNNKIYFPKTKLQEWLLKMGE
ncbi:DNA-binding protein [Scopulibacillus cellulosilyticus]|uniref:DNA-binding protein n=1 Tax=Scopulibacillus cellulosilyticus TaxID=2665665 RepID=A0ABW2Q0R2_9BACL